MILKRVCNENFNANRMSIFFEEPVYLIAIVSVLFSCAGRRESDQWPKLGSVKAPKRGVYMDEAISTTSKWEGKTHQTNLIVIKTKFNLIFFRIFEIFTCRIRKAELLPHYTLGCNSILCYHGIVWHWLHFARLLV